MPTHKWRDLREAFLSTLTEAERAEREVRRQRFIAEYERGKAEQGKREAACSDLGCNWQGRACYPSHTEPWPVCPECGPELFLGGREAGDATA